VDIVVSEAATSRQSAKGIFGEVDRIDRCLSEHRDSISRNQGRKQNRKWNSKGCHEACGNPEDAAFDRLIEAELQVGWEKLDLLRRVRPNVSLRFSNQA